MVTIGNLDDVVETSWQIWHLDLCCATVWKRLDVVP